jgi:hypothetical protein
MPSVHAPLWSLPFLSPPPLERAPRALRLLSTFIPMSFPAHDPAPPPPSALPTSRSWVRWRQPALQPALGQMRIATSHFIIFYCDPLLCTAVYERFSSPARAAYEAPDSARRVV